MPRFKRRTKIISIRLSEDEHDRLQDYCSSQGIPLSELIRSALSQFTKSQTEIDGRISTLDREVARLSAIVGLTRLEKTQ